MQATPPPLPSATGSSSTSNAWKEAVQQYLSRLSDKQKTQFMAAATPQDCLTIIEKARYKRRKTERLLAFLQPVIEPLKRFEGTIDVVIQVNTGITSPIWGPLRMGITIATEHYRALESMVMIVDRIISCLKRISMYETLFQTNDMVQSAIGALYGDFLDFQTRVIDFYTASPFRNIFVSIESEFRVVSLAIDNHTRDVDSAANAAHMKISQARNLELEKESVLRWLSPSTVQDDLDRLTKNCLDGSFHWLLKVPEFTALFQPDYAGNIASIQGPPGWGKSTIAAYAVDQASKMGLPVLQFFNNASDVEKRSLLAFYRTILYQLVHLDETIYDVIRNAYKLSGRPTADSLADIERALNIALAQSTMKSILLIVDAVDESEDPDSLLCWIRSRISRSSPKLVILCTARHIDLPLLFTMTPETSEERSDSLRRYIQHRAQSIPYLVQDMTTIQLMLGLGRINMTNKVMEKVFTSSQGVWLNARLILDEIERLSGGSLRNRKLDLIPVELDKLYAHIIKANEALLTESEICLVQQLYLWLDIDEFLPDYVVLGYDFFQHHTLQLCFQYANKGEPVFDSLGTAYRLSAPLIEVSNYQNGNPDIQSLRYEVRFTHISALEYIQQCNSISPNELPKVLKPRRLRHLHRARVAIWYFTECPKAYHDLSQLRNGQHAANWPDSYMEMSYSLWGAMQLTELPSDMDDEETATAIDSFTELAKFFDPNRMEISSIHSPLEGCRCFAETAMSIDYLSNWSHLLHLTVKTLHTVSSFSMKSLPIGVTKAFKAFQDARMEFLQLFVKVLRLTGPKCPDQLVVAETGERRPVPIRCAVCHDSLAKDKSDLLKLPHSKGFAHLGIQVGERTRQIDVRHGPSKGEKWTFHEMSVFSKRSEEAVRNDTDEPTELFTMEEWDEYWE